MVISTYLQVARYDLKKSVLPAIEVRLRSQNQTDKRAFYTAAKCEIYLGRDFSANSLLVMKLPAPINEHVHPGNHFEFRFDLIFSQELLYRLDKLVNFQQDVIFTLNCYLQALYLSQESPYRLESAAWQQASCLLEIKMSDWARIAYDWGREMVLVPMLPKTHGRIKEVMANSRYLRSVDEVFAELLNRYAKEE
jgi:hypothetical protein